MDDRLMYIPIEILKYLRQRIIERVYKTLGTSIITVKCRSLHPCIGVGYLYFKQGQLIFISSTATITLQIVMAVYVLN